MDVNPFDDLPIIQCRPAPSDAELERDRDEKHTRAVAEWMLRQGRDTMPWLDAFTFRPEADHIPPEQVIG